MERLLKVSQGAKCKHIKIFLNFCRRELFRDNGSIFKNRTALILLTLLAMHNFAENQDFKNFSKPALVVVGFKI